MTIIEKEGIINRPKDEVWDILADYGNIHRFNPSLKSSHCTSDIANGLGATRQCELKPIGVIQERIIRWVEGRSYTVEIYEGEKVPPFQECTATLSVEEENSHQTRVRFVIQYDLKYGFLGKAMDNIMVRSQFTTAADKLLAGLKSYAETPMRSRA